MFDRNGVYSFQARRGKSGVKKSTKICRREEKLKHSKSLEKGRKIKQVK